MAGYDVTIQPERMYYQFDNLFDGDQRLGDEINKVLNENWDSIYNDVKPGYEKSFGLIFQGLAEAVFSRVPINNIFIMEWVETDSLFRSFLIYVQLRIWG